MSGFGSRSYAEQVPLRQRHEACLSRPFPLHLHDRRAGVLEVLQLDGVLIPGLEGGRAGVGGWGVGGPVVDDELAVHPKAYAVVAEGLKAIATRLDGLDGPCPASAES